VKEFCFSSPTITTLNPSSTIRHPVSLPRGSFQSFSESFCRRSTVQTWRADHDQDERTGSLPTLEDRRFFLDVRRLIIQTTAGLFDERVGSCVAGTRDMLLDTIGMIPWLGGPSASCAISGLGRRVVGRDSSCLVDGSRVVRSFETTRCREDDACHHPFILYHGGIHAVPVCGSDRDGFAGQTASSPLSHLFCALIMVETNVPSNDSFAAANDDMGRVWFSASADIRVAD
jgi:hypothetical protein